MLLRPAATLGIDWGNATRSRMQTLLIDLAEIARICRRVLRGIAEIGPFMLYQLSTIAVSIIRHCNLSSPSDQWPGRPRSDQVARRIRWLHTDSMRS